MWNLNSGYHGTKMSNRAWEAYQDGRMPWSKWRKSDILDHFDETIQKKLKKYSLATLKEYFLVISEWHHTSSWFNETNFYEVIEDSEINFASLDRIEKENKAQKSAKKEKEDELIKARVSWIEFEGTRNHPRPIKKEDYAILKGIWAYTENCKKKVNGGHFEVLERYSRAPSGTAKTFAYIKKKYNLQEFL